MDWAKGIKTQKDDVPHVNHLAIAVAAVGADIYTQNLNLSFVPLQVQWGERLGAAVVVYWSVSSQ